MARPFRNEFEKESAPMSPLSAGSGTPTSYKTNVNRQKTKKWVEAKPADYGGDDWGDDDEYDLPPPPISKPTGLRQKGHALQSPISAGGKKAYGDLPSLPPDPRGRSNSFDADDEKRNFSSGPAYQQPAVAMSPRAASGPPVLHISTQQPPHASSSWSANQIVSPVSESPHPPIHQSGSEDPGSKTVVSPISDSRTPSSDYHARRDFSPSAVPPPLHTRAAPAPQSATDNPTTRFPPRQSSMGHQAAPNRVDITHARQESPGPKSWTADRSASPSGSTKSAATSSTTALPFVRPADIYRRVEEERERERQSMESGRPSMDSVLGGMASERSNSSAKQYPRDQSRERPSSGNSLIQERLSSDSLGAGGRRGSSLEGEDASDSSRRPMPMLAPVQERKSEYGFDGLDVNQQAPETTEEYRVASSQHIAVQEVRIQSKSPKLPDLNRMSGFGLDIFSQSKPEENPITYESESSTPYGSAPQPASTLLPASPLPTASTPLPVSTLQSNPQPTDDHTLRNQPSLGFTSVVHQAFDRPDRSTESSVPPTPASQSGSGIRRTDSESTGTTGISPIMSRVPSVANPDGRNRDGPPAVLEVVNETSPVHSTMEPNLPSHGSDDEPIPPLFKPGHRRDLSTPSPSNSPARTPDLARNDSILQAEHALLSTAPGTVAEAPLSETEPISQTHRPLAEREQSFRPQLPGGWQSFATTTGNATPSEDVNPIESTSDLARSHTPVPGVSPIRENQDEDDYNITRGSTTNNRSLPQSTTAAGVGAVLGGVASVALESHKNNSPERPPHDASGYDTMPTPDLAMAPSDSVSSDALDPRLLPKPEPASPEAQFHSGVNDKSISTTASGAAPTPPPKNTPLPEITMDDTSEYFPKPTVPLKQRSPAEFGDDDNLQPPSRLSPTLSTDVRPEDEESDKLRKEIIESLSPRASLARPGNDISGTDHLEDPTSSAQVRESTYLPDSIYDNYWQGDEGEEGSLPLSKHTTRETIPEEPEEPEEPAHPKTLPDIVMGNNDTDIPPTPPLNSRRSQQSQLSTAEPRPALTNRFSWEQSEEKLAELSQPIETEDDKIRPAHDSQPPAVFPHEDEEDVGISHKSDSSDEHNERDPALLTGAAAAGSAVVLAHMHDPVQSPESPEPKRRLSLAEEKDPRVSSYPVSQTPPEDEHPARSQHPYMPDQPDQPRVSSEFPRVVSIEPTPSVGPQLSPSSKLLQFREIAAMRDPYQRIQAFDEHRHRFAAMDSGLSDWLSVMQSQHLEYSDTAGSWGGAMMSPTGGPGRSKFAKETGAASPLQPPQPYYQQYLNASSPTTPMTPVARPGPNMPAGSQQGFSAGGGKLTSQQVQAKGKELLHTAGIFSGKAGKGAAKAGKGLLAKGKNRFRGSGVGDKITTTLPKPKNEQRTSWGLPIALSRPATRPESQNSREASRQSESREVSNTSEVVNSSSHPLTLLPNTVDLAHSTSHQSQQLQSLSIPSSPSLSQEATSHIPEISQPGSPEAEDNLSGPVPISKDQPSWDPYNSTPIVEEEAFDFDENPKPKQVTALPVPVENSERSNSGDAYFYDAHEDPSRDDDWVMVTPEPNSQAPKESQPAKAADQHVVTSILHRSRGSFDVTKSPPSTTPTPPLVASNNLAEPPSSFNAKEVASTPPSAIKQAEVDEVIPRDPSFKGLPPIRRTSAFGFGFGSRQPKPRFPIDDEDEDEQNEQPRTEQYHEAKAAADVTAADVAHYDRSPQPDPQASDYQSQSQQTLVRPDLARASSSKYSQQTIGQSSLQREPSIPRIANIGPRDNQRNSQDVWRLNGAASNVYPVQSQGPRRSEDAWRPNAVPPPSIQRQYVDPQQIHSPFAQRSDAQPRSLSSHQQKMFEHPPSSAFRYPQLFIPEQKQNVNVSRDSGELPDHYYQQPIHREEAFLPRQQTSEYQLPGVGPPTDEPRSTGSRRNSFFGGLSGKISRTASRERLGSMFRNEGERPVDSHGNEISESSPTSEESQTKSKHKRRSSFFGSLNRVSTGGTGPPQSRDSVTAQASGSRTDLLNFMNTQPSPLAPPDKKRSFFRSSSSSQTPKAKANKLSRASTSSVVDDGTGKKKRFSVLSSMFSGREKRGSKGSVPESISSDSQGHQLTEGSQYQPGPQPPVNSQPETSTEVSRAPSQQSVGGPIYQPGPLAPQKPARASSQQRKLTKQPSLRDSARRSSSKTRQESRSRRSSGSGFLGGILGRRSQDMRPEEQDTPPKPQSPQPTVPDLSVSQELQNIPQPQPRTIPWQDAPDQQQQFDTRGRNSSREPEPVYDNASIPGGYSLVRGIDGQVPSSYDPHVINQQYTQRYPRQYQPQQYYSHEHRQQQLHYPQTDGASDMRKSQNRPPNLGVLETYENYQRRQAPRRLSHEDILARSPARVPEGQQRPYQLTLPEEEPQEVSKDVRQQMPKLSTQPVHNRIQRLQQPVLRHPESPAGYPLPHDTVFSPINLEARNIPPPPAPEWPQQQGVNGNDRDLERSNTGRTGGSEVSQVSAENSRSLAPQRKDGRGSSLSPTPPSPGITPERRESPEPASQTVVAPVRSEEDLYNASPSIKGNRNRDGEHEGKEVASGSRRGREQEEKIFYSGVGIPPERYDDENATMSATSYPGQEWHPFTPGYEDWD